MSLAPTTPFESRTAFCANREQNLGQKRRNTWSKTTKGWDDRAIFTWEKIAMSHQWTAPIQEKIHARILNS